MKTKLIRRLCAAAAVMMLTAFSEPASAEESGMTFRMAAERCYFTASELAEGDAVVKGGLYIDHYSGISSMKLRLMSDAPLVIENGDFTRDASRTEYDGDKLVAKQSYFAAHGSTLYTGYSDLDGSLKNIALWYGPGSLKPEAGTVENPDGSFLSYEIRIPQNTPAGVYRCYVSEGADALSGGLINPDLFVYDGEGDECDVQLEACEIVVEPAALRGDVNCDGVVDVLDAQAALRYYATVTLTQNSDESLMKRVLGTPFIHTGREAAEIIGDADIDLKDAMAILRYSSILMTGGTPSWDDVV